VTDNLTGVIWLQNANPDSDNFYGRKTWSAAILYCNNLAEEQAGLSDGSSACDWRLPNVKELQSLIDYGQHEPTLPSGHPFSDVPSNTFDCWLSTTHSTVTVIAWYVRLGFGDVYVKNKGIDNYVWPVRGGQ